MAFSVNDSPGRHRAGDLNLKDAAGPGKTGLPGDERGIALLLVLWVIVFLAFVCAEFSWTMRTETATTSNFKEGIQAYYVAEAGINRAVIELQRASIESRGNSQALRTADANDSDTDEEPLDEGSDDIYSDAYDYMPLWVAGGGPYRFELGDFYCEVSIIDESNKLNINEFLKQAAKNPMILKMFLNSEFGLEGEERDLIADSMIDWWDANDDITGTLGAEDAYYMSLDPPYLCRNGNLPVIEDLLLVSGVTERLFYGRGRHMEQRIDLTADELESLLAGEDTDSFFDDLMEDFIDDDDELFGDNGTRSGLGLIDLFSVTSQSTSFKININSATYEQLMLLEGMQPEDAKDIIAERSELLFANIGDRLPQYANYEVWKGLIRAEEPSSLNNFTVYARGFSRDGRISRGIRCNLQVSASRCVISDWRLDI